MIIKIIYKNISQRFPENTFLAGFQLTVFENRCNFKKKSYFANNHADERKAKHSLRDLFGPNQENGSE